VKETPFVSVTIPTYNSAPYLARTLQSLVEQTYRNFEIIVVDDGSTDATPQVVEPFLDRIVYHRQPNGGLPAARNKGFELARGEFIAWMDSDDLCDPERLAVQVAYLQQNPHVVAIGTEFAAIDVMDRELEAAYSATYYSEFGKHGLGGLFTKREEFDGSNVSWAEAPLSKRYEVYSGEVWRRLIFGNFMHPPTMMMRRSAVEQAGKLREGITSAEDWEYITRLSRLGHIAFVNAPLLRYRKHPGQMSLQKATVATTSRIDVLSESWSRYQAELVGLGQQIRRQLNEFHQEAAYMYTETNAGRALVHLTKAVVLDPIHTRFFFHLMRILTPHAGLTCWRKLRARFT
jgi:glycosyltransferase involved in cell wall biosynthesis